MEPWLTTLALLDEAIERDPRFTRAYVARSELHFQLARAGYDPSEQRLALARQDAEAAQRLAPDDPAVLAAQALLAPTAARALELFQTAERAGLTEPDLLFEKAGALTRVGRFREGVELISELAALDPGNQQLAAILWVNLLTAREPRRALEALDAIRMRSPSTLTWDQLRGMTLFYFGGNAQVLEPWSGEQWYARMTDAGLQDPGDALRNNVERLIWRERYAEARTLIDTVPFDTTRNVFVGPFLISGTGETPNADYRGWTSMLLDDSAAAAEDGRRVLEFLDRTPETPANRWYRLSLRADASVLGGDRQAAAANTRTMLDLTEAAQQDDPVLRNAARVLAARSFAWAGEHDAAVEMLERLAFDEPGLPPAFIARQPLYTVPLRNHARFLTLVARLDAQMAATNLD
jgi:tetratricopeptide (TPR) repeat protein